jgi:hypothetical protein
LLNNVQNQLFQLKIIDKKGTFEELVKRSNWFAFQVGMIDIKTFLFKIKQTLKVKALGRCNYFVFILTLFSIYYCPSKFNRTKFSQLLISTFILVIDAASQPFHCRQTNNISYRMFVTMYVIEMLVH